MRGLFTLLIATIAALVGGVDRLPARHHVEHRRGRRHRRLARRASRSSGSSSRSCSSSCSSACCSPPSAAAGAAGAADPAGAAATARATARPATRTTRAASGSPTPIAASTRRRRAARGTTPPTAPPDRRLTAANPLSRDAGRVSSPGVSPSPERPVRTILVIEDEPQIASLVRDYLEHAGFAVLTAGDGSGGLALARARRPDAIVLDLGLPRVDGLDVVRSLRRDSTVPIVILTARGDEVDRITGLELGADDYVVKPFSPKELVARVRAVLRRAEAPPAVRRADRRRRPRARPRPAPRHGGRPAGPADPDRVRAPGHARPRARTRLDAIASCSTPCTASRSSRTSGRSTATSGTCAASSSPPRATRQLRPDRPRRRLRARGAGRVTDDRGRRCRGQPAPDRVRARVVGRPRRGADRVGGSRRGRTAVAASAGRAIRLRASSAACCSRSSCSSASSRPLATWVAGGAARRPRAGRRAADGHRRRGRRRADPRGRDRRPGLRGDGATAGRARGGLRAPRRRRARRPRRAARTRARCGASGRRSTRWPSGSTGRATTGGRCWPT